MTIFSSLYTGRLDRELGSADSTQLFTTARRKAAVNEGQEQFVELTGCLRRRSTIVITGNTAEYDLNSTAVLGSSDFMRLLDEPVEVRYTDASSVLTVLSGDDLVRRDVAWLDRNEPGWQVSTVSTGVQLPSIYYIRPQGPAFFLGFWPTPSTGSSASMTAILSYVAQPVAMVTDATEPFTVNSSVRIDLRPYHQALVHYAASQLEKFRRDTQASDRQLQVFLAWVQRFLTRLRRPGGETISMARRYFGRVGGRVPPQDPRT